MQYAAYAGRIPITLKHNSDSDGLLLNQENAQIEYDSFESLVDDVDRLLDDQAYRAKREALLKGAVVSEAQFAENLRMLIEAQVTDFQYQFRCFSTKKFQEEFLARFNLGKAKEFILNRRNYKLVLDMPSLIPALVKKIRKKYLQRS